METLKVYEKNERPEVSNPKSVFSYMQDLKDSEKEVVVVFYLDTKNKVIAREIVNIGILDASIIHPREIFRGAILRNSNSILISHNHPSGDPEPSSEDREITQRLKDAGEIIGIKLLDHVIVGFDKYFSFAQEAEL